MASAWNQLEQMLTCAICLDKFKNPRLLPCQHSFCGDSCMDGLVDYARRQIKCPECRAEHRIPYQGVQSLPVNVTLIRFLELHARITGEEPEPVPTFLEKCAICGEKVDGVQRCWHCDKKVCPECKEAHLDLLRREIGRINGQARRSLGRLQEFDEALRRASDRLKQNHASVRKDIEQSCKRLIDDLQAKQRKLLDEVDAFRELEDKTIERLKGAAASELAILQRNLKLADEKLVSNKFAWTDQELNELKEIFNKSMEFVRLFDPEIGDFTRKMRFTLIPEFETMRRRICELGELKFGDSALKLIASSLSYCNATGQVAQELCQQAAACQLINQQAQLAAGQPGGYGLAHSSSNSNLGGGGQLGGPLSGAMLELPSMQNALMRSQSDHRLASQFQQRLKQQEAAAAAAAAAASNSNSAANKYGLGRDYETDSLRSRYAPPPAASKSRDRGDYAGAGSDLLRDWPRPSDPDDSIPFGSSIQFKSAFMKRKEKERSGSYYGAANDDDEDLTSEASFGGLSSIGAGSGRNVRFYDPTGGAGNSSLDYSAAGGGGGGGKHGKPAARLFDMREVEHAPLSGVPNLDECPHLHNRLHQMGAKAKVDAKNAEEEGKRDRDLVDSARQAMNQALERKGLGQRQPSEDEIEKQKRENKQQQQQQLESITSSENSTISRPAAALNNADGGGARPSTAAGGDPSAPGAASSTPGSPATPTAGSAPGGRRSLYGQAVTEKSRRQLSSAMQDAASYVRRRSATAAGDSLDSSSSAAAAAPTSTQVDEVQSPVGGRERRRVLRSGGRSLSKQGSSASVDRQQSTDSQASSTPTTTRRRRLLRGDSSSSSATTQLQSGDSSATGSAAAAQQQQADANQSKNYSIGSVGGGDHPDANSARSLGAASSRHHETPTSSGRPAAAPPPPTTTAERSLSRNSATGQMSGTTDDDEDNNSDSNNLRSRIARRAAAATAATAAASERKPTLRGSGDETSRAPDSPDTGTIRRVAKQTSAGATTRRRQTQQTSSDDDDDDDDAGDDGDEDDQDDRDEPAARRAAKREEDDEARDGDEEEDEEEEGDEEEEAGGNAARRRASPRASQRGATNRRSREFLPNAVNKLLDRSAQIRRDSQEQRSRGDSPQRTSPAAGPISTSSSSSTAASRSTRGDYSASRVPTSTYFSSAGAYGKGSAARATTADSYASSSPGATSGSQGGLSSAIRQRLAYQRSQSIRNSQQHDDEPTNNSKDSVYTTASSGGRRSSNEDAELGYSRRQSGSSTDRTLTSARIADRDYTTRAAEGTQPYQSLASRYSSSRRDSAGGDPATAAAAATQSSSATGGYQSRFLARSRTSAALSSLGSSGGAGSGRDRSQDYAPSRDAEYGLHQHHQRQHQHQQQPESDDPTARSYLSSRDRFMQSAAVVSSPPGSPTGGAAAAAYASSRTAGSSADLKAHSEYLRNKFSGRRQSSGASSARSRGSLASCLGLGREGSDNDTCDSPDEEQRAGRRRTSSAASERRRRRSSLLFDGAAAGLADHLEPDDQSPDRSAYSQKGRMLFKLGSRGAEPGRFTWPRGVAVGGPGGARTREIVVADSSNHRVQVFDTSGAFLREFGAYGSKPGQFDCLAGVAIEPKSGGYIVSDRYNHRVQVFDASGQFVRSFGELGREPGKFNLPWGVACDSSGSVFVCDKENHRVQVFDLDGTYLSKFGSSGTGAGQLQHPHYIAAGAGRLVVTDTNNHRVQVYDQSGRLVRSIGREGSHNGQFKFPRGVAMDDQGYIVVGDSGNNRLQVFAPDGRFVKAIGTWGSAEGEFKGIEGVAVDSIGNRILVCDRENHRIQVF